MKPLSGISEIRTYDATVDDAAKITTRISQLAALGIIARDTA